MKVTDTKMLILGSKTRLPNSKITIPSSKMLLPNSKMRSPSAKMSFQCYQMMLPYARMSVTRVQMLIKFVQTLHNFFSKNLAFGQKRTKSLKIALCIYPSNKHPCRLHLQALLSLAIVNTKKLFWLRMMKYSMLLLLVLVLLFSRATVHVINFSYPNYEPNSLSVFVGDTILWRGDLTRFPIFSGLIPDGAKSFSSTEGDTLKYVVNTLGVYKYQCPPYRINGMSGYFIALQPDTAHKNQSDSSTVYINFVGNAFHVVSSDYPTHNIYKISINTKGGLSVYNGEIPPEEKDKWIATEGFNPGNYMLTVTDGKHIFGRRFSK